MPTKKKVTKTVDYRNELIKTLRREINYLRKRVAALEARELELVDILTAPQEPEDTGYEDLDWAWKMHNEPETKPEEQIYGKDEKPINIHRNVNDLVKEAKNRHETKQALKRAAEQEKLLKEPEEDVETTVTISEAKKKRYVETASQLLGKTDSE